MFILYILKKFYYNLLYIIKHDLCTYIFSKNKVDILISNNF